MGVDVEYYYIEVFKTNSRYEMGVDVEYSYI